ncbi:small kinetochore-associated protein [Corythoichthys intestinalis]|uniref:small kinetochore-associated protein n=1 Tax=Corythoichthys intestinalis TaxID=161448 RepID=UPI0025A4E426|nr:small kinetochore-associated protein [Corythoichthys intestinalis]
MSKFPRGVPKSAYKKEMKDASAKSGVGKQKEVAGYGLHGELKEQNQQLAAAKEELQKELTETQLRVTHLEQQFSVLEKENCEVKKKLHDCQIILVAEKMDPISGEVIVKAVHENEEERKEVMHVATELLNSLKAFDAIATQQRSRLQEIQKTVLDLNGERDRIMQERQTFILEADDLEKALMEAEALLL